MIELVVLSIFAIVYALYFFYWFKAFRISAPYYPTSKKALETMLEALNNYDVKHVVELGAGDGRVAIALVRAGYEVTAVEFNPILAFIIQLRKILGRHNKLHVLRKDFLKISYEDYDGAFIYLYPKVMDKLSEKIRKEMPKGAVLISNTFKFNSRTPALEKENKVYVYVNGK